MIPVDAATNFSKSNAISSLRREPFGVVTACSMCFLRGDATRSAAAFAFVSRAAALPPVSLPASSMLLLASQVSCHGGNGDSADWTHARRRAEPPDAGLGWKPIGCEIQQQPAACAGACQ